MKDMTSKNSVSRSTRWLGSNSLPCAAAGATLLAILGLTACGAREDDKAASGPCSASYRQGMLVIAQLQLFNNMVEGYKEGFSKQTGIPVNGLKIDVKNAQGNPTNFQTLARSFASGPYDLLGVIGTPTTIALAQSTKNKPIVTVSIEDPVGAKLADSVDRPGSNVTGSIDIPPSAQVLDGILALQPNAKTIGTIYTSGNDASLKFNKEFGAAAKARGVKFVQTSITGSNELQSAARSMVGDVDAMLIGRDGNVAAGLPAIGAQAQRSRLPLYLAYTGPGALVDGVVGGFGSDEREVGELAGVVAGKICKGADPATTPFSVYTGHHWQFRKDTLAKVGLTVPDGLTKTSEFVNGAS
ncbi:ABC transporter substrate-binding protein [Actinomadura syzygii]|nr:ABC transporter substrate-binding protein [Actinomadura syzygii]